MASYAVRCSTSDSESTRALEFARNLLYGESAEFFLSPKMNPRGYWPIIQELKRQGYVCAPNCIRHENGFVEFIRNPDRTVTLSILRPVPAPPIDYALTRAARSAEPLMWRKIHADEVWKAQQRRQFNSMNNYRR